MTKTQEAAIAAIEEQQKKLPEFSTAWVCAEQIKDICRNEPDSAELILKDLEVPEMSVVNAEQKIKKFADKHKTGNSAAVSPMQADEIIREFYGLPKISKEQNAKDSNANRGGVIDITDFL